MSKYNITLFVGVAVDFTDIEADSVNAAITAAKKRYREGNWDDTGNVGDNGPYEAFVQADEGTDGDTYKIDGTTFTKVE